MLINRTIVGDVESAMRTGEKVIIIYGPRQSGKTTLIKKFLVPEIDPQSSYFAGDDLFAQRVFGSNELEQLKRAIGSVKTLVIDEAQRIDNIGLTLKLIVDNLPITILVSGSASLEIADKISEPLTGRTKTFWLYPFSYQEIAERYRKISHDVALEEMLRFGMYPEVHNLTDENEKKDYLYEYINTYLYKDILSFEGIRKPKKVMDLLALLALQIGKEVALSELASTLTLSQKALQNYLDVLEKMFVIVNLRGFSRNLRKEIYKTSKYYFVDVGLRNAIIRNFNPLNLRPDVGEIFENWFMMEKTKLSSNLRHHSNFHFWRTYDKQEIDLIEERDGKLIGYECKWSPKKKANPPRDWLGAYDNATFNSVNPSNCFEHLSME